VNRIETFTPKTNCRGRRGAGDPCHLAVPRRLVAGEVLVEQLGRDAGHLVVELTLVACVGAIAQDEQLADRHHECRQSRERVIDLDRPRSRGLVDDDTLVGLAVDASHDAVVRVLLHGRGDDDPVLKDGDPAATGHDERHASDNSDGGQDKADSTHRGLLRSVCGKTKKDLLALLKANCVVYSKAKISSWKIISLFC